MPYRILTIICLVALCLEVLFVILRLFFKKRSGRISFLRSFKKGKCVLIFLTALPLYFAGHLYSGDDILASAFTSLVQVRDLVVLSYGTGGIEELMAAEPIYYITIYLCFLLVTVNAVIFALSLSHQHLWRWYRERRLMKSKGDKLFIFGKGSNNRAICESDRNEERERIIIGDITKEESAELYLAGIAYAKSQDPESMVEKILSMLKDSEGKQILVINTGSDDENIRIAKRAAEKLKRYAKDGTDPFGKVEIFVFGDQRYEAIYEDVVSEGLGCIHYVNKYQMIATDFIDRYPFTKFMNGEQIDYSGSLVKEDVDVNAIFIGFGKTGQRIFLTSVANNQFIKEENGKIELETVNYHIFDKESLQNNKNLNHGYFRYEHELEGADESNYLPLPALPAKNEFYHLDINSPEFYKNIRRVVTKNEHDANFIVIAFGSDLENIDMAQKLVEKRKEWGVKNLVIFVKVRDAHKEDTLLLDDDCFFIANERDSVYDIEKIIGSDIHKMAIMRNQAYDLEYDIAHGKKSDVDEAFVKESNEKSTKKWYTEKSQLERESSLYCCLSLRSKLHMMGLDYRKATGNGMSESEYMLRYAGDDMPTVTKYSDTKGVKPVVSYTIDFKKSRRRNMAIHEHLRWNSFMISKGMIPATLDEIKDERIMTEKGEKYTNGKNYAVRRHGNLTTFDGLVTFRKMVAERSGCTEEEADVIRYDYQLLDDAHWLLSECGYEIIEKENK